MAESNGSKGKDWRELCSEASREPDSEKLVSLVHQIPQAFDESDQDSIRPKRLVAAPSASVIAHTQNHSARPDDIDSAFSSTGPASLNAAHQNQHQHDDED